MHLEHEISIFDFVYAISEAADLISPILTSHHKRVARISYGIAQEMNLSKGETEDVVLASLLHDIGAFSANERIQTLSFDFDNEDKDKHAEQGYRLLKNFEPLNNAALIVKNHHSVFDGSRSDIPLGSYIVHMADRASILFDEDYDILRQIPDVLSCISNYRTFFHPDVYSAFEKATNVEYHWIEAFLPSNESSFSKKTRFRIEIARLDTLRGFAKIIAQIIDFRSKFTATHSSGVAAVALELSDLSGFSERESKLMEIAGLLHDLGKLTVSNDILEKPSALNRDEFNSIKKHTYYTYVILNRIAGLEQLATWASYHHERQDGCGYPFHVKESNFSKLARIVAVADIVTALTEDRPYRLGMNENKVKDTLASMVKNGGIDKHIVELVNENYEKINSVRSEAQRAAQEEYKAFYFPR